MKKLKFCRQCGFDASDHRDEDPVYAASCPRCSENEVVVPLTVVDLPDDGRLSFALAIAVFANVKRLVDSLRDALWKTTRKFDDVHSHSGDGCTADDLSVILEGLVGDLKECLGDLSEEMNGWIWTIRRDFMPG